MNAGRPVVVVTGASSGIGRAAATALARAGFAVVGTARDTTEIPDGDGVTYLDLDVARDESVDTLVAAVLERLGRIDVLVNNAGIGVTGAAEEASIAEAQRLFDVNVFGVMRMTRAVLPHMRAASDGRIVNVTSVLGFLPAPFASLYAASKHAIEGYSESTDHEVRQHGVRVLLVEPGYTNTGFEGRILRPATSLPAYAEQRRIAEEIATASTRAGDDPAIVAATIVAAATDPKPKLRYPAGSAAARLRRLRRLVPAGAFDTQIRKFNKLPA